MRNTFSIIFYLKRDVVKRDGTSPIMGRITVNGKQVQFSCMLYVKPEIWDPKIYQAKGKSREAQNLNKELDNIYNSISQHYRKIFNGDGPLTAERVKNSYLGFDKSCYTLLALFEQHIEELTTLVNNNLRSPSTAQTYNITYKHLKNFIRQKYKLKDVAFVDIQSSFIVDFEIYLRTKLKCSNNTACTYIMPLKKMIGIAQNNGWISYNPFYTHKLTYKQNDRSYLTTDELNLIMSVDLSHCSWNKQIIRDQFIFSCFTGIPIIDLCNLTSLNIIKDKDGTVWLSYIRKKTGTTCNMPLLDIPLRIIKKYERGGKNSKIFDVPHYTTCLYNIRAVAKICGITKTFGWHCSRHTFASEICLLNGVPIETISRLLGHTNVKTTQVYAKLSETTISRDMRTLSEKLNQMGKFVVNL